MARPVYPNMYILLVAPPGVGKSTVISEVVRFWRKTSRVHVAPNSVTAASLVDCLREAGHTVTNPLKLETWTYHSLLIGSEEFGNLITTYDMAFMSGMCEFFDCVKVYSEMRRGRKKDEQPEIPHPQIHMIAGTQPQYLSSILPEAAWGQGFMSRNIMIYAGQQKKLSLFTQREIDTALENKIIHDLECLSELSGEFTWDQEASDALVAWYETDLAPVPQHLRLENYKPRRLLHFVKLCMAISAAESSDLLIRLSHHQQAMELLLSAEAEMPQVFQAMASTDDTVVVDSVYNFVLKWHARKKSPVARTLLIQYLAEHIPLYRIDNFLQVLESSGIIRREPQGYTPGTRSKFDAS